VGTPLSLLQLEPALLQAINEHASAPGMSDLRLSGVDEGPSSSPPPPAPPHCRSVDTEAAFVCKKCRLAFPSEAGVMGHQRTSCCPMQVGWTVRLVQVHYECSLCGLSFDKAQEMRRHCDTEGHRSRAHLPPPSALSAAAGPLAMAGPQPDADSPAEALSPDMEEVVNQIAALAAKAAAEGTVSPDSNANLRDFCQPQKATYAVPSAGH